jgi:hypothetical protein
MVLVTETDTVGQYCSSTIGVSRYLGFQTFTSKMYSEQYCKFNLPTRVRRPLGGHLPRQIIR